MTFTYNLFMILSLVLGSETRCSPTTFYKNCWIRRFPGIFVDIDESQRRGAQLLKFYQEETALKCSRTCCLTRNFSCNLATFHYDTVQDTVNCFHLHCPTLESCILRHRGNVILYNVTAGADPDLLVFGKDIHSNIRVWPHLSSRSNSSELLASDKRQFNRPAVSPLHAQTTSSSKEVFTSSKSPNKVIYSSASVTFPASPVMTSSTTPKQTIQSSSLHNTLSTMTVSNFTHLPITSSSTISKTTVLPSVTRPTSNISTSPPNTNKHTSFNVTSPSAMTKSTSINATPPPIRTSSTTFNSNPLRVTMKCTSLNFTPSSITNKFNSRPISVNATTPPITTSSTSFKSNPLPVPTKPTSLNYTPLSVTTKPNSRSISINATTPPITTSSTTFNSNPLLSTTKPNSLKFIPLSNMTQSNLSSVSINSTAPPILAKPNSVNSTPLPLTTMATFINYITLPMISRPSSIKSISSQVIGRPITTTLAPQAMVASSTFSRSKQPAIMVNSSYTNGTPLHVLISSAPITSAAPPSVVIATPTHKTSSSALASTIHTTTTFPLISRSTSASTGPTPSHIVTTSTSMTSTTPLNKTINVQTTILALYSNTIGGNRITRSQPSPDPQYPGPILFISTSTHAQSIPVGPANIDSGKQHPNDTKGYVSRNYTEVEAGNGNPTIMTPTWHTAVKALLVPVLVVSIVLLACCCTTLMAINWRGKRKGHYRTSWAKKRASMQLVKYVIIRERF